MLPIRLTDVSVQRSNGESCLTCRWRRDLGQTSEWGRCTMTRRQSTLNNDWCGQHQTRQPHEKGGI